jgi:hypothetical protein
MKMARLFLYSAGAILLVTAIAKLVSIFGHGAILQVRDPLVGIPFRILICTTAVVEACFAAACFYSKRLSVTAGLVAWLASSLAAYRLGLWWIGYHKPCNCLGNLTEALHVSLQAADLIMKSVLVYLVLGSYATLLWLWKPYQLNRGLENPASASRASGSQSVNPQTSED